MYLVREVKYMTRNKKPSVHTLPNGNGWKNVQGGKTVSNHYKKSTAKSSGRRKAKRDKTEHRIHNRDGKIGRSNSYGNDPYPPRG